MNPDEDSEQQEPEVVSLAVTGSDTLYAEVRDQHVEKFGSFLQNQAKALRESHANFTNKEKKKDLSEIHQFVKQIPVGTRVICDVFVRHDRISNAHIHSTCYRIYQQIFTKNLRYVNVTPDCLCILAL